VSPSPYISLRIYEATDEQLATALARARELAAACEAAGTPHVYARRIAAIEAEQQRRAQGRLEGT